MGAVILSGLNVTLNRGHQCVIIWQTQDAGWPGKVTGKNSHLPPSKKKEQRKVLLS